MYGKTPRRKRKNWRMNVDKCKNCEQTWTCFEPCLEAIAYKELGKKYRNKSYTPKDVDPIHPINRESVIKKKAESYNE